MPSSQPNWTRGRRSVSPRTENANTNEPDLVDALKGIGPAIGAAVSFEVAAKAFLGNRGALGLVIPILSAAGLLTVCIFAAFAKSRATAPMSGNASPKYPRSVRVLGFVGALLLAGIVFMRVWQARPNFIDGQAYEAGFLCDAATGLPLGEGKVVVLSRGGIPMSQAQELDGRGFFYSELQRNAFLPEKLEMNSATCKFAGQIDIDSSESGACQASRDAAHNSAVVVREWRVKCQ
jgi:hypothetical protein